MSKNFPKLSHNQSDFPLLGNVDVYKYDNDFDYGRFDYTQMELIICTVPWDMGEVHIGNRTLSGVGNVVYFETKAERDKWFDSIPDDECYRFETKFKELHRDHVIDVPVPYDMCAKHNYLVVRYAMFANDDSPVQYEQRDGLREWFWFIREVEFVAPNTTRLHLLDDAWQTWIHDVNVTGMVLERGHAPMFSVSVEDYLAYPIDNNENLLTEDVNFGNATQAKHIDALALNAGNMYACIATTANPLGTWGTKAADTWNVPASASYENMGVPSVFVFAVAAENLATFLSNVNSSVPQFKQTIQGVFFASSDLVTLGTSFTFASMACYPVNAKRKTFELTKLNKTLFGYDAKYADIAKLYTSPYAHIEITDESGNADIVKIEDTTGTISASVALSIAYPFVNIESHLLGTGGNAQASITFKNITAQTFDISGQWYDTLRTWKVPTFAVVLDAATEYDYGTHFDREQRVVDYTTNYDNSEATAIANKDNAATLAAAAKNNTDASATAAYDNVVRIAGANRKNAHDAADTLVDNATLNTQGNTAIANRSNSSTTTAASNATTYSSTMCTADNTITDVTALSTIAANQMQGSISANSQMAQAGVSMAQGLMNMEGGALFSLASASIGSNATLASTAVSSGLTAAQAAGAKAGNNAHATIANKKTNDDATNEKDTRSDITSTQNGIISGTTANTAATQKANATRTETAETLAAKNTRDTDKANATRTQNATNTAATNTKDTAIANATRDVTRAQSAIDNDIAQAALRQPFVFGSFSDGESAATKPIALFSHIVTQSKGAISSAGDEMLRYGYTLDKQWNFDGDWNIGKYFTYWKLRDFWVSNLNVPDMYMDRLRFFLYGGVTVWRNPEDIGKRTVYENFNG